MEYELGEQTEHRLKEMGARCVDKQKRRKTEQELNHTLSHDTNNLEVGHSEEKESKILNSSLKEQSETSVAFKETSSNESPEKVMSKSQVQRTSSDTSLTYTELNDPCSIMLHLSKCLQLPLTHSEMQSMTMQNFLNMAQIQMYDSWTRTSTIKYSLPGGFSLVVERNYRIPTETPPAFLMMNADVLSISSELEKMDRLCKELGLKPKASSDE
ncbi:uncharacterized protein LOC109052590 [Cyprinus carpio]|uniref:Uncharacterized protein LOC109052590 n=1 Tax=Cyprinus carpio TaxID=7962 RepID=A0A9Q9YG82_CYPCA|nr:uncharacterized protein LOC109052590 [Cyprinus carpio]